jgi:hypothetical protein
MFDWLKRRAVVLIASTQLGLSDASKYWKSVGQPQLMGQSWCGAFTLWALHKVGIARNVMWQVGSGYLSHFPITTNPQPGDIAYFDKYEHEAIVSKVVGSTVNLINGNGTGGKVTASTVPISTVKAFYNVIG